MMGKAQQAQRSYVVPALIIIGISLFVLYLSGNGVSGELVRRPSVAQVFPLLSNVELSLQGSLDSYWIDFTNLVGTRYSFRYLTSFNNTYRYGEASSDLVFVEASSLNNANIGVNDIIVLSNQRNPRDIRATSDVVHYTNFDSANQVLTLVSLDPTRNTKQFTYQSLNATGYCDIQLPCVARLIYAGNTYIAYIVDMLGTMAVDLNADTFIQGTKVNVVAQEITSSGQFTPIIIDLGTSTYSGNGRVIPIGAQIPLTLYQGDPARQPIIVDSALITAVTLPTTTPLTVLQVEKISGPN